MGNSHYTVKRRRIRAPNDASVCGKDMPASLRSLIERADRFVRSVDNARREPDRWERLCTLQALADIAAGRTEPA